MKTYWGVTVEIHVFLTSEVVSGEWSASHRRRFALGKGASGTHWVRGWVGLLAGLDPVEKRET
jgi:hypothetical protein